MLKSWSVFIALLQASSLAVCNSYWGGVTCGSGTVNALENSGIVTLNGTKINNYLIVQGSLQADNTQLHRVQVAGASNINNSIVNGAASFTGSLVASKSNFINTVTVTSNNISLDSCNLGLLVVHQAKLDSVVKLTGNTIVEKIKFDSNNGEVWVFDQAKIKQPVIGAKVVYK